MHQCGFTFCLSALRAPCLPLSLSSNGTLSPRVYRMNFEFLDFLCNRKVFPKETKRKPRTKEDGLGFQIFYCFFLLREGWEKQYLSCLAIGRTAIPLML